MPFALRRSLIVLALCGLALAQDPAAKEEAAFKEAAAVVAPSMVKIETVGGLDRIGQVLTGTGPTTGVVVSADGYIISSAFNFAAKPAAILATLADGRRLQATEIATDRLKKLTLLKVEANDLVPPQAAPVESIRVGQWAIALGKTFDDATPSVSVGIVSALKRIWGKAIQTDAKISPVNYGGPLVDVHGRVMGILVPLSPQGTNEVAGVEWYDSGIGFAIPLAEVQATLDRLKQGKDLQPGLMGITVKGRDIYEGEPTIDRVRYGSPAQEAGLKEGDVLVELNGQKVVRQAQVQSVMGNKYAGDTLVAVVKRGDETIRAEMTLTDKLVPYESAYLGILPSRTSGTAGVSVRFVFAGSPAAKAGIDRGQTILKLGEEDLANATELLELVSRKRPGDTVKLTVKSEEESREVEVALGSIPPDVPEDMPTVAMVGKDNATRPADAPKIGHFTERLAGHEHDYWAYIPEDYNPEEKYGLVVYLHPTGDVMEASLLKAWKPLCERRGLIFVAPKSKELTAGWNPSEAQFVKELTEGFLQKYSIDKSRVVIHGFGSGGGFALQMAFKERQLYRGALIFSAGAREPPPDNDPEHRVQFHFASGDSDPMHGAVVLTVNVLRGQKYPVTHTIAEFGEHKYPLDERLEAIARWVDMLDRI